MLHPMSPPTASGSADQAATSWGESSALLRVVGNTLIDLLLLFFESPAERSCVKRKKLGFAGRKQVAQAAS